MKFLEVIEKYMFKHFNTEATIQRLVRVGNKSSYQDLWITLKWHLKPLSDEKQNIWLENLANMYGFTFKSWTEIKEADKLLIDSQKYSVRWVENHSGLRVSFSKAILVKEK